MTASAKSAGIISKPGKPEIAKIVPELLAWFRERGYTLVVDPETAPYAHGIDVLTREEMGNRPLNFVVVLGGNGTLLSAARAVSKATGSTAYSLAAGGPILMPSVDAFVITPVSAHSLTHRALVVRDTSAIEIVVRTGEEEAYLSVDGQVGMPMLDGDRIQCRKSQYQVKLLHTHGTFFDVLRTKLKWGQR